MDDDFPKSVRLVIAFTDRAKARQALEELLKPSDSKSHLQRGRLTKKAARLEVEVREDSEALDDLFRLGRSCGGSVRRVS